MIREPLLRSNPETKVIVSCEDRQEETPGLGHGRSVPPFIYVPRSLKWIDWDCMLVRLAPPTTQSLLRAVSSIAKGEMLAGLQQFQSDLIDVVALGLCVAFLRLCDAKGMLAQGVKDVEALLTSARAEAQAGKGGKLHPDPILAKLWGVLSELQQILCIIIAASDDGVRKSSLCWILQRLRPGEEWKAELKELR